MAAARKLTARSARSATGRFLVEGAQAVREAFAYAANSVHELFVTEQAASRHADLLQQAEAAGTRVSTVTPRAAEMLSETKTPQGLVAVCDTVDVPIAEALSGRPRLVVVLFEVSDPGNAGTVVRVADAAGADAVVFAGDAVDPHNGKCVRASTGSLFHLPVARARDAAEVFDACRSAGLRVVAADGAAEHKLDDVAVEEALTGPTAWVFGNEAHGLPAELTRAADTAVAVPIHGAAESLNLATAAAVCLYATARIQRITCRDDEPRRTS